MGHPMRGMWGWSLGLIHADTFPLPPVCAQPANLRSSSLYLAHACAGNLIPLPSTPSVGFS